VWDFIPKQLFFQFTRVGNFYFLCVGIPQMVSRRFPTSSILAPNCVISSH
jgi:phospholipid-translocating ATPase